MLSYRGIRLREGKQMKYKMRGHLLASTIICGSIMAVFAADQAQAQEQKKEVQEIVVTGSRIARKDFQPDRHGHR